MYFLVFVTHCIGKIPCYYQIWILIYLDRINSSVVSEYDKDNLFKNPETRQRIPLEILWLAIKLLNTNPQSAYSVRYFVKG